MLRIVLAAAVLLACAPPPLQAQGRSDARGPLEVDGAVYAELDERTGLLTLRGAPVTVRRGAMTLRAPSLIYDTRQRIIRATGGVVFADPTLGLEAPDATVWIDEEHLLASGGVSAAQRQGAETIRLRAARLEVFGREQRAVATGAVEAVSADATVTGDRIEVSLARDELLVEGNARVIREDLEGRAPRALLRRGEGLVTLSGGAVVRQGSNEARGETITVDLRRRRLTAAGQAIVVVHPSR